MAAKKKTEPKKTTAKKAARKPATPKVARDPAAPKVARKSAALKVPTTKTAAPHSEGAWAAVFAPRAAGEKRYWLVKSEPTTFSFDDLLRLPNRTTHWDGVRNFVARNFMRDGMRAGDRVFFYHSSTDPQAIVGICDVAREGYPDHTALDRQHAHFDPDSDPAAPRWFQVDLKAVAQFTHPVTLTSLKDRAELKQMAMLRIGRLSVTPVTAREWQVICDMAG